MRSARSHTRLAEQSPVPGDSTHLVGYNVSRFRYIQKNQRTFVRLTLRTTLPVIMLAGKEADPGGTAIPGQPVTESEQAPKGPDAILHRKYELTHRQSCPSQDLVIFRWISNYHIYHTSVFSNISA